MDPVVVYLLVNVAVGALACFFGRRLFFAVLGALVFLGVFDLVAAATDGSAASFAVAVALGVMAALLSKLAYRAGVFLMGFLAGAALGFFVTMALPQEASSFLGAAVVVTGLLVGLAATRWSDLAVRLGTAWSGASLVVPNVLAGALAPAALAAAAVPGDLAASFDALSSYVGGTFSAAYGTPVLAGTVVLAVVGAVAQGRSRR